MADKEVLETKGKMEEANSYGGGDAAGAQTGRWFKPKEGSLIPSKRKPVMTMMVECLVSSLCKNNDKRKISPHDHGSA